MSHAEICPICKGKGVVLVDPRGTSNEKVVCHGCNGKGWVTVGVEYPPNPKFTKVNFDYLTKNKNEKTK